MKSKKESQPNPTQNSKEKASKTKATSRTEAKCPVTQQQILDTNATATQIPYNRNKADEYGEARQAGVGETIKLASPLVGASTVSEHNTSAKTGNPAIAGYNPGNEPLDQVRTDAGGQALTTNQGVHVADNQNSLKAGLRGPALLKDFILREKITHFDHERIPERIVHARGSGAHGFFECYAPLAELTRASLFAKKGKQTPVFVRFSTVSGERGSTDTARDARGFAVKFYTDEGNWDLVGNNIPVFFIQDAMKFPDLIHAVKPEPHHGMPQAASAHDTFWDFVSLMPESTHMLMWVMSDRAIPRSLRMMQGFGVHTFRFVNASGESVFVKFHWDPIYGTHSLLWDEAVKLSGADSDFHRRDLWEAIEDGNYPEWELGVQIFTEAQAEAFSFDVLDATKLIPEELVPVQPIGRMVLNRNPDNFFAETEQVAFCAAHVVPGIDFSNDPLLAGRIHSYVDTQISRLGGPNFHELPINAPVAQVHNNQRDGMHRQTIPRGRVAYEPNSLGGGCPFQVGAAGFTSFPEPVEQDEVRGKPEKFAEHFNQAKLFFDSQTPVEQQHIINAFCFELSKLTVPAIRVRVVSMLRNVSDNLAAPIAQGLGIDLPTTMPRAVSDVPSAEISESAALSLMARPGKMGIRSRKIAILIANGVDTTSVNKILSQLRAEGATGLLIGPRIGPFHSKSGTELIAEGSLDTHPAVVFDGVVIPDGQIANETLQKDPRALEFIQQQFKHGKTILSVGSGARLLEAAQLPVQQDSGLLNATKIDKKVLSDWVIALSKHKHVERENKPALD